MKRVKQEIIFIFYTLLFIGQFQNSLGQTFSWAKQMGGADWDESTSVAVDSFGNVFSVGTFMGTADFDPGVGVFNLTSIGNRDIFILKLDASGNFIWAKQLGDAYVDRASDVAVDDSGNVYTTGFFTGTVDFDPSLGTFFMSTPSTTHGDAYILKLDNSGNFIWAVEFGGIQSDRGVSLCIDNTGHIYSTGIFSGTVDFDPTAGVYNMATITGVDQVYVSKLNSDGSFVWAKNFGAGYNQASSSIAVDNFDNVYTVGYLFGIGDFDPGPSTYYLTSSGYSDIFISKLNSLGNFIWAKQFGDTLNDDAKSITVDLSGHVLTAGSFYGTIDFDPGISTNYMSSVGQSDVFILKLDSTGNFIWAKQFGDTLNDYIQSIIADTLENVLISGSFYGTIDFDPGIGIYNLVSSSADAFITKLDSSGNFIWAKQFGGNDIDAGFSLVIDKAGNIYSSGIFSSIADFNPDTAFYSLSSFGQADAFVLKLSPLTTAINENTFPTNISIFPNPTLSSFNVNFNYKKKLKLIISDIEGRNIYVRNIHSSDNINIEKYPKGIYSIELWNDGRKIYSNRIVKQ